MSNPGGGGLRPRFKGIENFLRRIAFNLGNSPSQTEVKIISCIPIDVTDLQNKIIELEKELDDKQEKTGAFVNTALVEPFTIRARSAATSNVSNISNVSERSSLCAPQPPPPAPSPPPRLSAASVATPRHSLNIDCSSRLKPQPANGYTGNNKKSFEVLHKLRKMNKKKTRGNTQMVYYAQTINRSPFRTIEEERNVNSECKRWPEEDEMSRSYLEDVVRRQYQPERVELSGSPSSHFSSPVCRDDPQPASLPAPAPLDSDICSCCHGHFHNLDISHGADGLPYPPSVHRDVHHSTFYDSSLYDVIPVKEASTKVKNQENSFDSRRNKFPLECDSFPEKFRAQPRYQPYVVNYTAPVASHRHGIKQLHKRKVPIKSVHKREHVIRAMQKRKVDRQVSEETSNSGSVNCGEVYMKLIHPKPKPKLRVTPPQPRPLPPLPPPVLYKNAECLTISVNDTECQTATSRSVQLEPPPPPPQEEDKTEITLNQIKSILHAVLIEVKTNAQVKNVEEDKSTKDAVVQKGQSQSHMQAACSSFMNSYSYSPYNMDPYAASYSGGQLTGSQYPSAQATPPVAATNTVPFPHMKCMQNYPLFIQTTGRQCACCYRNMPATGPARAPAAHTATNTDSLVREQRSKETEKLIKEIYKSIAINMTYPAKESSTSDYADLKSDESRKKFEFKISNRRPDERRPKVAEVSSETRRPSVERKSSPVFEKKAFGQGESQSNSPSFQSEPASNTTTTTTTQEEIAARGEGGEMKSGRIDPRVYSLLMDRELQSTGSVPGGPGGTAPQYAGQGRGSSPSDEDTESPVTASDTDSEATVVEQTEKKEKKGLFSKMVKLFTTRSRRRRKKDETSSEQEQEDASDSDDYETVVSQQIDERVKQRGRREQAAARRRPHSKVSYSRYQRRETRRDPPARPRRSPYMEQEYRRHWNENLSFQDPRRYSSERPQSRERRAPFWSEYEARAAHVQRCPTARAQYPGHSGHSAHSGHPSHLGHAGHSGHQGYPAHPGYGAYPGYPAYGPYPPPPPAGARPYGPPQVKQDPIVVDKKQFIPPRPTTSPTKGLAWLKKHKLGIHCGEQWKRLILDG